MSEYSDDELDDLIRSSLEEGGGEVRPEIMSSLEREASAQVSRRGRARWFGPLLMAASLAVMCGLVSWRYESFRRHVAEGRLSAALSLIEEIDGVESNEEVGLADRLLAWQDAPYVDVVSQL